MATNTTQDSSPRSESKRRGVSRRTVLKTGTLTAAASLVLSPWAKAGVTSTKPRNSLFDRELFLVNRLTMGFTIHEYKEAKRLGYQAYLDQQLDHLNIDDSQIENLLAAEFPSLRMTPIELWRTYVLNGTQYVAMLELRNAMALRSIFSKRQLFQRMAEFWTDHFSISHDKSYEMKTVDDREVVRAHALGNFKDMLIASAHSPAMLYYLDNWINFAGLAQENYSRELLELHTLGVGGGYTETDVKELARCLTGWTITNSAFFYGKFAFRPALHDDGAKTVLGFNIGAGGGISDGEFMLGRLGSHKSTRNFIATKMCRWLLSHNPPDQVVENVRGVYHQTQGDIQSMVREIFRDENVDAARPVQYPKLKRPYHYIVSLARAAQVTVGKDAYTMRGDYLMYWMYLLGQYPFGRATPDGYPDKIEAWGQSLLPRWQFASALFDGQIPHVTVHLDRLEKEVNGFQRPFLAEQLNYLFMGGAMAERDIAEVQRYVDNAPYYDERIIREAMALAASSPSFQYY